MKCKVTLKYGAAVEEYVCLGDLRFSDSGFSLVYGFDGDKCNLSYDGKTLTQSRRGKMKTDITFICGKRTDCFTEDTALGYKCALNVKTHAINYSKTESGLALEIDYKIEDNRTILNITAEIFKEKK